MDEIKKLLGEAFKKVREINDMPDDKRKKYMLGQLAISQVNGQHKHKVVVRGKDGKIRYTDKTYDYGSKQGKQIPEYKEYLLLKNTRNEEYSVPADGVKFKYTFDHANKKMVYMYKREKMTEANLPYTYLWIDWDHQWDDMVAREMDKAL